MLKKLLLLALPLTLLFGGTANAEILPTSQVELIHPYSGDQSGDFIGDPVFRLYDGSEWKCHPKDAAKVALWGPNDVVEISVRTSFYFFKREHKFFLTNHTLNDTVRVMVVKYPNDPLYIMNVEYVEVDRKLKTVVWKDIDGNKYTESKWVIYYNQYLHLNDGSTWLITDPDYHYEQGIFVYLCYNYSPKGFWTAIASGTGRDSQWIKAIRTH
jgi:hypothetical protein